MEPKKITLPLGDYLDDLLRDNDYRSVPLDKGALIAALDPTNDLTFIQTKELDGEPLSRALVWRIKAWRNTYTKWQMDKKASAARRREANLVTENTTLLMKRMALMSGIDDKELFRNLAKKLAIKKSAELAREVFKTEIEL